MAEKELTDDIRKLIVRMVGNGTHVDVAAAAAGVSKEQVKRWLLRGATEEEEEPYYTFRIDVLRAEAEKESDLLGRVASAGQLPEFWAANAWILARRFPDRWQEKVQLALASELQAMMRHLEQHLDTETYTKVLEALADPTVPRTIRRPLEATSPGTRALTTGEPPAD